MIRPLTTSLLLAGWLLTPGTGFSQSEAAPSGTIAATVGTDPIEAAEVQRLMDSIFRDKQPAGELLTMARAQVLEEVVNRRLVIAYARRTGDAPSDEELAKAKKQFQMRLSAQGRKVADVLKAESMTAADLENRVLWRLVWDRYLAKYRTPARREAWFKLHHREVDGTELVVSHILLRPDAGASQEQIETLKQKAAAIREEVVAGKLEFAAAAERHSAGPSGKQGGRLGKIGRQGPMDEAFTRAAFQLQAGQISPPVCSPFGVHLIRCDEVVPGAKKLGDVVALIDDALAKELLQKLSDLERKQTPVKYTTAWPHFKPGTLEIEK